MEIIYISQLFLGHFFLNQVKLSDWIVKISFIWLREKRIRINSSKFACTDIIVPDLVYIQDERIWDNLTNLEKRMQK